MRILLQQSFHTAELYAEKISCSIPCFSDNFKMNEIANVGIIEGFKQINCSDDIFKKGC